MKQETTTVEIGTDNSAQETLMGTLIGMTGGMTGALAEMNGGVEALGSICAGVLGSTSSIFGIGQMSSASLAAIHGGVETLGSICGSILESTSSIFSIEQMSNASLAAIAEGSGSSVGLLEQMTDGITQLVIASDTLCDGVLKLVENTARIFRSVPNEGARYGKPGPTKIRAEPETKIKRGNMKNKSKSRSRFNQAASALEQKVRWLILRIIFIYDVITSKTAIAIAGNLYDIFSTNSS